jgi:hypothetical protein
MRVDDVASDNCQALAMGFLLDDTSYLKDGWNVMDFTVGF